MKLHFIYILPSILISFQCLAQRVYQFDKFTVEEGLPHNVVNYIFRDSQGVMWIGTEAGLARFDGYRFINYTETNGINLPAEMVNVICEDYKGRLWLGYKIGLYRYDPKTNKTVFYHHYPNDHNTLTDNNIQDLAIGPDSSLFIGTGKGFCVADIEGKQFRRYYNEEHRVKFFQSTSIYCFSFEDHENTWIGARNSRLLLFNKYKGISKEITIQNLDPRYTDIQLAEIRRIVDDKNGSLWLSTSDGLIRFDKKSETLKYFYPHANINSIVGKDARGLAIDAEGRLWVGTRSGLSIFDPKKQVFTNLRHDPENPYSLSANTIQHIFNDPDGVMWISTLQGGINKIVSNPPPFDNYTLIPNVEGVSQTNIYSLAQTKDGTIWSGSFDGVLEKIDPKTGKVQSFKVFPKDLVVPQDANICSMADDGQGNLWLASWTLWLLRFDTRTNTVTPFRRWEEKPNGLGVYSMRDLLIDQSGNLWIASIDLGLNKLEIPRYPILDPEHTKFERYTHSPTNPAGISTNHLLCLAERGYEIWIGTTDNGIDILDTRTNTFKNIGYKTLNSPDNNWVNYIHFSRKEKNTVWIGTNLGLIKLNTETLKTKTYTDAEGLSSKLITSIKEDNTGTLWVATSNGLNRFDPITGICRVYNRNNGILIFEFNQRACFHNPLTDRLFFGGTNGFTSFLPADIKDTGKRPATFLSGLKVHNQYIKPGDTINNDVILSTSLANTQSITLQHYNNNLGFEFATSNYASPGTNQFKFRMSGIDSDWQLSEAGRNDAYYSSLPPGDYLFEVFGVGNNGLWSDKPVSLKIKILPPFYKTLWFRILSFTILIMTLSLYYLIRLYDYKRQKKLLEKMVRERTFELEETNTILEEKQEEINQQNEELLLQRDALEKAYQQMTLDKEKIEAQNEELDQNRKGLEEIVFQRTRELAEALAKAEESDRLKSAFLANMSHEIRTPMNAILGFSNLLSERDVTEEDKASFIDLIQRNGEILLVLIDDILDLSKIQAQQLQIVISSTLVDEILTELYEYYKITSREKGISLILSQKFKKVTINTDRIRLRQILSNLISNAIKFTETGSVEFGVWDTSPEYTTFYVKDTGIGIPDHFKPLIFDRFLKVDHDKTHVYGGAGLGLAISKGLTELLRGKIWFDSQENIGTTFFFTVRDGERSDPGLPKPSIGNQLKLPPDLSGKLVLIAEDEEANFLLLKTLLTKLGATIFWAQDGKEAVDYIEDGQMADLVLMDLKMPVMDGAEATKLIKTLRPGLPIIAQTAFARPEEKERFSECGFDGYLAKPINFSELKLLLTKYLLD